MRTRTNWNLIFFHSALIWMLVLLTALDRAQAGTYNFYFNNTEQGDNSTATPNVTIKDGKDGKDKDGVPTAQASPAPTPSEAAPAQAESAPAVQPSQDIAQSETSSGLIDPVIHHHPRFRLMSGAAMTNWKAHWTENKPWDPFDANSPFPDGNTIDHNDGESGLITPAISGYVTVLPDVDVGLFISKIVGAEFEATVLKSPMDSLELSLLGGVAVAPGQANAAALEAGARLSLLTAGNWGLTATARTSLHTGGSDLRFQMYEAGLIFKL